MDICIYIYFFNEKKTVSITYHDIPSTLMSSVKKILNNIFNVIYVYSIQRKNLMNASIFH